MHLWDEASLFARENYAPTPGLIFIYACPRHTAVQISVILSSPGVSKPLSPAVGDQQLCNHIC